MVERSSSASVLIEACNTPDVEALRKLLGDPKYIAKALETEEQLVDEKYEHPRSVINLLVMFRKAAAAGNAENVEFLLSFANTHDIPYEALINRDTYGVAISCSNNVAVWEKFLAVSPESVDGHMGHAGTPLTQAIIGGTGAPNYDSPRAPLVRLLLEHGADPNRPWGRFQPGPGAYLEKAAHRSSLEVVELLLQYGAQIKQSGAMHRAAQHGRIDVMAMLFERGGDVNEQLWENDPWWGSKSRTTKKKEYGIEFDNPANDAKWDHETPLHFSVLYCQAEATAWLMEKGADADLPDSQGWSARDMAVKIGDAAVLEALEVFSEAIKNKS